MLKCITTIIKSINIKLTTPSLKSVLFELFHSDVGTRVVHLQDLDEVRYGEHPHHLLPLRVP